MIATKSSLSTESPPFNPNPHRTGLLRGGSSPVPPGSHGGHAAAIMRSRSRSSSPYPSNDSSNSNAIPKFKFEHNG